MILILILWALVPALFMTTSKRSTDIPSLIHRTAADVDHEPSLGFFSPKGSQKATKSFVGPLAGLRAREMPDVYLAFSGHGFLVNLDSRRPTPKPENLESCRFFKRVWCSAVNCASIISVMCNRRRRHRRYTYFGCR